MTAEWYYAEGQDRRGPISDEVLRGLVVSGQITASTLIWRNGMDKWQPAGSVDGLVPPVVNDGPPPLPPQTTPQPVPESKPETLRSYTPPPCPDYDNFMAALRHPWHLSHNMPDWLEAKWTNELCVVCEPFRSRFEKDGYFVGPEIQAQKWRDTMYRSLAIPPDEPVIAFKEWGAIRGHSGLAVTPVAIYWKKNFGLWTAGPYRLPFTMLFWANPKCEADGEPYYGDKKATSVSRDGHEYISLGGRAEHDLIAALGKRFIYACGHKIDGEAQ